jgi:5-methylcytosine-specific restriction endonuclease McrA
MTDDVLLLTKADEHNYRALCAFMAGRNVRRTDARRKDVDTLTPARKLRMLAAQDYLCPDCGMEFKVVLGKCKEATLEHVIPFKYGGEANGHNTLLLCYPCNLKRDTTFSLATIEAHYGPVDQSMIEYVPVINFRREMQ